MAWAYSLTEIADWIGASRPADDRVVHSVSTDTRSLRPGDLFFALKGERFDAETFVAQAFAQGAAAAVTTRPHAEGPCLVVGDPLAALQTLATRHRARLNLPIFALTGSAGKTTAKDMTAALLASRYRVVKTQGNLNNEIGCPLSLLRLDHESEFAVIEMGANHMGEIAALCSYAKPTEAAITIIAPAHLEGFGSIENVARAKGEIVQGLPEDGIFYVNTDDPRCVRIAEECACRKVTFGHHGEVALRGFAWEREGEARLHIDPIGDLRLPLGCRAHATNVLLAIAVALQHGVTEFEGPLREACAASARFKRLRVGTLEIIDDTYNANPASMAASIDALAEWPVHGARIAALGDMLELGDAAEALHREVGERAARAGIGHLFALGAHAYAMIDAARAAGAPHAEVLDSHQAIAEAIHAVARPGDLLLVKGSRGLRMENVIAALQTLVT